MEINSPPSGSSNLPEFAEAARAAVSAAPQGAKPGKLRAQVERMSGFLRAKETLLWWLHSSYALLFGLGVMWLGARNFAYLRLILFHISFIWISSLFLPVIVNRSWIPLKWHERVRLVINYFNKNFYQQLTFFLLPVYYASTTFGSRNTVFLVLLAISAVLSTMDIVYDRYLSVRWQLTALFFIFNLFASINVMLPVLWSVSNHWALRISAIIAFGGFASMLHRLSGLHGPRAKLLLVAAAFGLFLIISIFPSYIPPAPLTLTHAEFGATVRAQSLQIVSPLDAIPSRPGRIALLTAIKAPMGMEEKVRHRWYLDGKVIYTSNYYSVTGGNKDGYRLWTYSIWNKNFAGRILIVDVETQGGQLIGRATLRSKR